MFIILFILPSSFDDNPAQQLCEDKQAKLIALLYPNIIIIFVYIFSRAPNHGKGSFRKKNNKNLLLDPSSRLLFLPSLSSCNNVRHETWTI